MNWALSSVGNVVNFVYNQHVSNAVQSIIPFVNRRVDDLYRFIHAWVPSLYGELDENYWRERGYILLDTDTDLSPELSPHEGGKTGEITEEGKSRSQDSDEISDLTRESWERSMRVSREPGGNPAKETAKNGRLYWLTADQGPLRKAVQHPEDVEHIGGFRADPGSGGTDPPKSSVVNIAKNYRKNPELLDETGDGRKYRAEFEQKLKASESGKSRT
ncbi:hypothetical protein K0M31_014414 [Melipona bicolor]|uniref:Uncharacterized protein n=1 Tax=Melipona bicolor TaxID=60889 RepID=A0AA40KU98_9HYME|nr:hypothetical protein K0M31_014414 [Melipona bicolor]